MQMDTLDALMPKIMIFIGRGACHTIEVLRRMRSIGLLDNIVDVCGVDPVPKPDRR